MYNICTIVFMVIFIIFLSYYATMLISKKSNVYFKNRNIKILERTMISSNFSIIVIQVIDKVYILAVQNKNIETIDILSANKWHEQTKIKDIQKNVSLRDFIKSIYK